MTVDMSLSSMFKVCILSMNVYHECKKAEPRLFPLKAVINEFHEINNIHKHASHSIDMLFEYLEGDEEKKNRMNTSRIISNAFSMTYADTKLAVDLIISNLSWIERSNNGFQLTEK
jgi:hypothetical protein